VKMLPAPKRDFRVELTNRFWLTVERKVDESEARRYAEFHLVRSGERIERVVEL
jgi:hypothetical protein